MLYKSLILGVLFGIGIFAVKSGVGLSYGVARRPGLFKKFTLLLLFALAYGLVFGLIAVVLGRIDPVRHLTAIQSFLQSGMTIHLVMAALMALWGVVLLKGRHGHAGASRGWLLLVLPCPVCASVILFSAAFLHSFWPDQFAWALAGLYLAFVLLSLAAMGAMALGRGAARSPESLLGGAMVLMAAYFLLSVTVMPQFAGLEEVYRLSLHRPAGPAQVAGGALPVAALVVAAFAAGFGFTLNKTRRRT